MLSIPFVLVGLHRVLFVTNGRLATTPPPASVSHADIFASLAGEVMSEFPNSNAIDVSRVP